MFDFSDQTVEVIFLTLVGLSLLFLIVMTALFFRARTRMHELWLENVRLKRVNEGHRMARDRMVARIIDLRDKLKTARGEDSADWWRGQ